MRDVPRLQDDIVLTPEGRAIFEGRAAALRRAHHLALAQARASRSRLDPDTEQVIAELARIEMILRQAETLPDRPRDPETITLGDRVTIEADDGTRDTFVLVHPVEAPLDLDRISVLSPLSRAVLGRHVGDDVEIHVPPVVYRCRIVAVGPSQPRRREPVRLRRG